MKKQKYYINFNDFILRTPLYPLNFSKKLIQKENISNDEIISLCKNPIIKEAIYIASPILFYEMQKWINGEIEKGKKSKKNIEKLKLTLIRYLLRMSTRCTPFGLFAGITTGNFNNTTEIELLSKAKNISHTRLDMNYLCALALDISKIKDIKYKLKFYPNSSIYIIGNKLRYTEYKYVNGRREYNIVAVDNSKYLNAVLKNAKHGSLINNLIDLLVDIDNEISFEDANDFINELIESQLLVSDLEPAVTGDEFLDQIIRVLKGLNNNDYINNILKILNQIKFELDSLKLNSIGHQIILYEKIIDQIKQLKTEYDLKYLFQTDMVIKSKNCNLNTEIADSILEAFEVLNKLNPKYSENNLSEFKKAFYERYEEEEEIPLLQVLDNETGIGYLQNTSGDMSNLVDDLILPGIKNQAYNIKWNNINNFLNKKYLKAIASNRKIVEITDDDIKEFDSNFDDLPVTISAMIQIIKKTENKKTEIYIKSIGGSTAANLIGRFCHADKNAYNLVNEIIEKDEAQNQEYIYAEIVHLPESRTGNILLRPILRKYEIPYLAKSNLKENFQLSLNDLYISVKNNKIYLLSKKLNKFIIPRLTTAHNYSFNALPIYQFLCDLQTQNLRAGLVFNWGPLAQQNYFLPRVVYKNIILSRACWNFDKKDFDFLFKIKEESEQIKSFISLAKEFQLPDEIVLADSDNELYLNLKNKMCIKILLNQIINRGSFTLKEFLFNDENLIINSTDGKFTNEFIISFYKKNKLSVKK